MPVVRRLGLVIVLFHSKELFFDSSLRHQYIGYINQAVKHLVYVLCMP